MADAVGGGTKVPISREYLERLLRLDAESDNQPVALEARSADIARYALELATTLSAIRAALTRRPCHVTGEHRPDHHVERSCQIMQADTLTRLLDVLDIGYNQLPGELHPPDCYWCHHIPDQEEFRQRLRESWEWAGVPLTPAILADAPDKPQQGDQMVVLALVGEMQDDTTGWAAWADVIERAPFTTSRGAKALSELVKLELLERSEMKSRSFVRLPAR